MKSIGRAAELLRKAAAALRGKAGVLRARLLFLASLRRRAEVVAGISRQFRSLAPGHRRGGQEKAPRGRAMVLPRPAADRADAGDRERRAATPAGTDNDDAVVGMAELASLFQQVDEGGDGGSGYQDWTLALHSLFDDEERCGDDEHSAGGDLDQDGVDGHQDDGDDDEPSVLELIRSRREGEGQEFRIDDEIDRAAGMYITRVRRRMSKQTELVEPAASIN